MYPRPDTRSYMPQHPSLPPQNAQLDYSSPISAASTATAHSHAMVPGPMMGAAPVQHPTHHPMQPFQGTKGNWRFSLHVEQQPVRARMCGFGDKDRRPITPPPCIRLVVTDLTTGKEVDPGDVDSTFYVLTVDLWNSNGDQEVNLVRHSSNSPAVSISTASTTSYPPPPERPILGLLGSADGYAAYMSGGGPHPVNPYGPPGMVRPMYPPTPTTPATQMPFQFGQPHMPQPQYMPAMVTPAAPASGMFTRNLIGSLTVNAFKLKDTDQREGFWFVLQDLSVRTEGSFRLKMNFVDVGSGDGNTLNQGKAPVLATTFSDAFTVYSAKKFPGVIESTPLSKVFASQGIKIPIRKDGPKQLNNQAEYDNEEP